MQRYVYGCLIAVALCASALAEHDEAQPEIVGSFNNGGDYTITYFPDGHYALAHMATGVIVLRGESTSKDGILKMMNETGPYACSGVGEYNYEINGDTISFSLIADACPGRKFNNDGRAHMKISIPDDESLLPQSQ